MTVRALVVIGLVCMLMGFYGLYMYGSSLKESVLTNVGTERGHIESQVVMLIYVIILICHIPYMVFALKEGVLVMFDELHR